MCNVSVTPPYSACAEVSTKVTFITDTTSPSLYPVVMSWTDVNLPVSNIGHKQLVPPTFGSEVVSDAHGDSFVIVLSIHHDSRSKLLEV